MDRSFGRCCHTRHTHTRTLSNGTHMDQDHLGQDWVEPAPEPLTLLEWLVYVLVFFVVGLEFAYMWEWCQWFTNCPKT